MPDLDPGRFTAMTRLDHNRAVTQIAQKLDASVNDVRKMTIWGNHSTTQYPDLFHCEVDGKNAYEAVNDHEWVDSVFIPTVAKRELRSSMPAEHHPLRRLQRGCRPHSLVVAGNRPGDWVSMSFHQMVHMASQRELSRHSHARVRTASTRSFRVSISTTTAVGRSMRLR